MRTKRSIRRHPQKRKDVLLISRQAKPVTIKFLIDLTCRKGWHSTLHWNLGFFKRKWQTPTPYLGRLFNSVSAQVSMPTRGICEWVILTVLFSSCLRLYTRLSGAFLFRNNLPSWNTLHSDLNHINSNFSFFFFLGKSNSMLHQQTHFFQLDGELTVFKILISNKYEPYWNSLLPC